MSSIIFDYDGTIHESMHIYAPAVRAVYKSLVKRGLAPSCELSQDRIRGWIGITPHEMWSDLLPSRDEDNTNKSIAEVGRLMSEYTDDGLAKWYDGAEETLLELRVRGYRLILLSNCTISYLKKHSDAFDLEKYFDEIYATEQFDYASKSEIAISKNLLDCGDGFVVGDRYTDVGLGKSVDAEVIGCAYGYASENELNDANYIINDIKDVLAIAR